jgi:hypothetical protein
MAGSTNSKSFLLPTYNEYVTDPTGWTNPVNLNWTDIDDAFGGVTNINAVAASGTIALTLTQYRPPNIIISGALSNDVNYQLPTGVGGIWSVHNNTSGAHTITISSGGGGSAVSVPQGERLMLVCDGTGVEVATTSTAAAGGGNTQIQWNNGGALDGASQLAWAAGAGALLWYGSTSGYVAIKAPATASNPVFSLPGADGSAGQALITNGSGVWGWASFGALAANNAWTGLQYMQGTATNFGLVIANAAEIVDIVGAAPGATQTFYVANGGVQYYTGAASANFVANVAFSGSEALNAALSVNQSVTIALAVTNGGTPYYLTGLQIDGVGQTIKWQGGVAPSAGHASSVDVYTFTIIKTGSAAYTVLGSQTQYA